MGFAFLMVIKMESVDSVVKMPRDFYSVPGLLDGNPHKV
jgi:hypothetical protein